MSIDYSQIELRILAHISGSKELIEAFRNNQDIHTKVAADIYGVDESQVTKLMRSTAKAVIFGIVYGISGFGLGENLNISRTEAQNFINKYYELYPGVKKYMDDIIKKAMVLVFDEFKKQGIKSKMVLQIHDELVIDTLKEEEEKVTKIVKDVMENVIKLDVPLKVGIAKGKDLYEAK